MHNPMDYNTQMGGDIIFDGGGIYTRLWGSYKDYYGFIHIIWFVGHIGASHRLADIARLIPCEFLLVLHIH